MTTSISKLALLNYKKVHGIMKSQKKTNNPNRQKIITKPLNIKVLNLCRLQPNRQTDGRNIYKVDAH